ncbi:lysylphosphatidylglycerol synthase transmembrane domain-containing protein [Halorientalis sp.]|uniref:lysylphosphatidylglycerol synthase transmembrane domain-containing protein n=1 Tax=Halorientalis sp. TaxID=1931229 RepID=UPI0026344B0D|nr:lysylphosphatidylglycerol synthase transmembrane domain-containing protein [Halorientalis sp.]
MGLPITLGRKGALWFGVTGLLFAILLYLADLNEFLSSIGRADPMLFAVAVLVGFSSLLVWALVWYRYFRRMGIDAPLSRTVRMFLSGHFLNSITPLGQFGGEPIMAYIVSDNTGTDYETSLACVISADILNATPFFTFTLGGLLYLAAFGSIDGLLLDIAILSVLIVVVGGLVAYLLWSENKALGAVLTTVLNLIGSRFDRAESVVESLKERVDRIEDAFQEAGSDPRFLATTAGFSHLAIVAQIVSLYFVFLSLGIEPDFVPLYLIVNLSVVATLSPTPGGSGTYEVAFSALVTLFFPVELATAVTAAVLFRLTTYWPGLLVGYVSMLTLQSRPTPDGTEQ